MITSDGVHDSLPHENFAAICTQHHASPQTLCDDLVAQSLAHGTLDNVTAVALLVQ